MLLRRESTKRINRLARAARASGMLVLPSRIAQSGYNAQTIVRKKITSADAAEPLAIGVDIGGTGIKAAVVSLSGELIDSVHAPSPRTVSALRDFVRSVVKRAKSPVRGIGVGCKGIIDINSTLVKSLPGDLHFLEGQLLSEVISAGDLPVCAENDARVALIGEVLWGAARGRRNVVMLTLGTGVGGAVLVEGIVLHGASGAAGHLGHTTIDPHGGLCICGNYGCLETRYRIRLLGAHASGRSGEIIEEQHGRGAESGGDFQCCCRRG